MPASVDRRIAPGDRLVLRRELIVLDSNSGCALPQAALLPPGREVIVVELLDGGSTAWILSGGSRYVTLLQFLPNGT